MPQPTFDHERLDDDRLSIDYVAFSYGIAKGLTGVNRPARDQWLRAAQSIPLNIAEGNGKQSLKDKNRFFEIARGSALECASIHDVLRVCDAIDDESNRHGKSELKRIVSMLTRLIQRTQTVAEDAFEYEYEYRDAEYEYEYEYRNAEYECEYRNAEYEYEYRNADYEYGPMTEHGKPDEQRNARELRIARFLMVRSLAATA